MSPLQVQLLTRLIALRRTPLQGSIARAAVPYFPWCRHASLLRRASFCSDPCFSSAFRFSSASRFYLAPRFSSAAISPTSTGLGDPSGTATGHAVQSREQPACLWHEQHNAVIPACLRPVCTFRHCRISSSCDVHLSRKRNGKTRNAPTKCKRSMICVLPISRAHVLICSPFFSPPTSRPSPALWKDCSMIF